MLLAADQGDRGPYGSEPLDNFGTRDVTPPPVNWLDGSNFTNAVGDGLITQSGVLVRKSTGGYRQGGHYARGGTYGGGAQAVEVWTQFISVASLQEVALAAMMTNPTSTTGDNYTLGIDWAGGGPNPTLYINREVGGAPTTIIPTFTTTPIAAGDSLGMVIIPSGSNATVELWKKTVAGSWTLVTSGLDTSPLTAAGVMAVQLAGGQGFKLGVLGGGNVTAGPTAYSLDAQPGAFALTGVVAGALADRLMDAQPGSFAFTGVANGMNKGFEINAAPGSFALTGVAATLLAARLISADPGSFALTGVAASPVAGRVISADPGSFALTGVQAGALAARVLSADPGSFAFTGVDAGVLAGRVLSADPAAYVLTGVLADLLFTAGAGPTAYSLDAQPASFLLTGVDAGSVAGRVISANPGAFALTGVAAGTLAARSLNASPGSFALTGIAASPLAARILSANPASFSLTGVQAGALAARMLNAAPGTFNLTGVDANVLTARVLNAVAASYVLSGKATGLTPSGAVALERQVRTILMSRFGIY